MLPYSLKKLQSCTSPNCLGMTSVRWKNNGSNTLESFHQYCRSISQQVKGADDISRWLKPAMNKKTSRIPLLKKSNSSFTLWLLCFSSAVKLLAWRVVFIPTVHCLESLTFITKSLFQWDMYSCYWSTITGLSFIYIICAQLFLSSNVCFVRIQCNNQLLLAVHKFSG